MTGEIGCQGRIGKQIKSFVVLKGGIEAFKCFFLVELNSINILGLRMFMYVAPGNVDVVRLGEKRTLKGT